MRFDDTQVYRFNINEFNPCGAFKEWHKTNFHKHSAGAAYRW